MRTIKDIFRSFAVLDADGRHINGTDKESNHHYGDAYESLFTTEEVDTLDIGTIIRTKRPDVKLMMEVGIADGSSLLAWREVFPNALCVGLDIHPAGHLAHRPIPNRIEFHLGDQANKHDCEQAARGRQFDFIVEDATHYLHNNLLTLFWLWPYVRLGGIYAIEEFSNVGANVKNIKSLFPFAEIVDTTGPSGGCEPLVVLRKQ